MSANPKVMDWPEYRKRRLARIAQQTAGMTAEVVQIVRADRILARLAAPTLDDPADDPDWLGWRYEDREDAEGRITKTKVPYCGSLGTLRKGSSTDPATWRTRAECEAWAAERRSKGDDADIGIVLGVRFADDTTLIGCDLDACIADDGTVADWAQEVIDRFASYTEISPGGRGYKIFARVRNVDRLIIEHELRRGAKPDPEKAGVGRAWKGAPIDGGKAPGIEFATGGRFFTITDQPIDDTAALALIDSEAGKWLIEHAEKHFPKGKSKSGKDRAEWSRSEYACRVAGVGYRARKFTDKAGMIAWIEASDDPRVQDWVVEKGNAHEYDNLWDEISTAPTEILELNEEFAVIITGSKVPVLRILPEGRDHYKTFDLIGLDGFKTWLADRSVAISSGKSMPLADFWIKHPKRRKYDGMVFAPDRDVPGAYNLWRGFAVDPVPGDCSRFLAHLRDNVAAGNDEHYGWLVAWLADIFQHPGNKCGTSVALQGDPGTGKTIVGKIIGSLLGPQHYFLAAQRDHVLGRFNNHHLGLLLLHPDEAVWAGDKQAEGVLKSLITSPTMTVEGKFKDLITVANHVRLLLTSEQEWIIPAGFDERRWCVLRVSNAHKEDFAYFGAIEAEMDNGGREALLDYLLNYDITQYNLRERPKTEALADQKIASMTVEQKWLFDLLDAGELPYSSDCREDEVTRQSLYDGYMRFAKQHGERYPKSRAEFGKFLGKMLKGLRSRQPKINGNQIRTYQLPSLIECRKGFSTLIGHDHFWRKRPGLIDDGWSEEEWSREPMPATREQW